MPKPNAHMTAQEVGLVKGAIRRVFSRSDPRRRALRKQRMNHSDPARPRVKTWYKCANCNKPGAAGDFEVDHYEPVIPLDSSFEKLTWEEYINRIWCDSDNLWAICKPCHELKCTNEKKLRAQYKRAAKI